MDDIKRRVKKRNTQSVKRPEIRSGSEDRSSAIEQVFADAQKIERPGNKPVWVWVAIILVGVVMVMLGALKIIGMMDSIEKVDMVIQTDKENMVNVENSGDKASLENTGDFDKNLFYGVATDDRLYFGKIIFSGNDFYRLKDVFYKSATSTVSTTGENIITLVKFGTEDYQPADELVLPSKQIKQIFPLADDSPILKAIEKYGQ